MPINGRLAQLVAHPLDVREVTSSSLVSSTKKATPKGVVFLFLPHKIGQRARFKLCHFIHRPDSHSLIAPSLEAPKRLLIARHCLLSELLASAIHHVLIDLPLKNSPDYRYYPINQESLLLYAERFICSVGKNHSYFCWVYRFSSV